MPSDLILPIAGMYDFTNLSVRAAVSDLTNEQAGWRMRDGAGSSITWITGHLLVCRAHVLMALGTRDSNPWESAFSTKDGAKPAEENPPIAELAAQWDELHTEFHDVLDGLTDAELLADGPEWMPIPDRTMRGMAQFFAFHESYHLGQIGLIRVEQGLKTIQALMHPETME